MCLVTCIDTLNKDFGFHFNHTTCNNSNFRGRFIILKELQHKMLHTLESPFLNSKIIIWFLNFYITFLRHINNSYESFFIHFLINWN
jgi:hypothetical protein